VCVCGWVGDVFGMWRTGDGLGWVGVGWGGLGVFPLDGFRGVGDGFVGRLFWREGNWGGCLVGGVVVRRVGVWLWYWGGFVMGGGGMAMYGFLDRGLLSVRNEGKRGW